MLVRSWPLLFSCLFLFFISAHSQTKNPTAYSEISEVKWIPKYSILSLLQDKKGFLWVGTNSGLFRYNGYSLTNYSFTHSEKNTLLNNTIKDIVEDNSGNIWIATGSGLGVITPDPYRIKLVIPESIQDIELGPDGMIWAAINNSENLLYRINPTDWQQNKPVPFFHRKSLHAQKTGKSIKCILPFTSEKLWIGSDQGLFLLDIKAKSVQQTPFNKSVSKIFKDNQNQIWIGSDGAGLFPALVEMRNKQFTIKLGNQRNLGNPKDASFNKIAVLAGVPGKVMVAATFNQLFLNTSNNTTFYNPQKTGKLFYDSSIYSVLTDKEENIWIGTLHGLYKLKNQKYYFDRIKLATENYVPVNNQVSKITSDKDGHVWIVSGMDGLFRFDPLTEKTTRVDLPDAASLKYFYQSFDGTYLINAGSNLYRYTGKIDNNLQPRFLSKLADNVNGIQAILEDVPGVWWLGTWNDGLKMVSLKSQRDPFFERVAKKIDRASHISCMVKDKDGIIWIGHRGKGLIKADRKTNQVTVYHAGQHGLKSDRILSLFCDKSGKLWVGTRGQGVQTFDKKTQSFTSFTASNGLPSKTICAFGEDKEGMLWVSTQNGLAKYLPGQPIPFQSYGDEDGIKHTEFSFNAAVNDNSGRLYFGNSDGVYAINQRKTDDKATKHTNPNLIIAGFNIINSTAERSGVIYRQLNAHNPVTLSYSENSFEVSFSSLNFTSPEKIKYAYRLKGHSENWQYANYSNKAVQYLNIPPGDYIFELKATNTEGLWNSRPLTFALTIKPHFLLSPAAILFYCVLLVITVLVILYFVRRWYKLNVKLKEETAILQLQTEQMVYFSDLSNEIKSRLNLILGPLETALSGRKVNKAILNNLYEQAQRLKRINEQIINIRKTEAGEFLLNAEAGDMKSYVMEVYEKLKPLALVKNIDLTFNCDLEELPAYFDRELVEIILLNILTSIIKNSPPAGLVALELTETHFTDGELSTQKGGNYIVCTITDSAKTLPSPIKISYRAIFQANSIIRLQIIKV